MVEFLSFPKIGRLKRSCVVTEKIDGTNAGIQILDIALRNEPNVLAVSSDFCFVAQSRSRIITPEDDNYGFAKWVRENADCLVGLGAGIHFGEWWGAGIQRRYGIDGKRFSLFNAHRWSDERGERPACCSVVPTIYSGDFTTDAVDAALKSLADGGSLAAPGFMKPEGVIVYHVATKTYFKRTIEKDDQGKDFGA